MLVPHLATGSPLFECEIASMYVDECNQMSTDRCSTLTTRNVLFVDCRQTRSRMDMNAIKAKAVLLMQDARSRRVGTMFIMGSMVISALATRDSAKNEWDHMNNTDMQGRRKSDAPSHR